LAAQSTPQTLKLANEEMFGGWDFVMKYGEAGQEANWLSTISNIRHWKPTCDMSAYLTYEGTLPDEDNDNLVHTFTVSATTDKWCKDVSGKVVLGQEKSDLTWTSSSFNEDS
jgi:hypothetical protein